MPYHFDLYAPNFGRPIARTEEEQREEALIVAEQLQNYINHFKVTKLDENGNLKQQ